MIIGTVIFFNEKDWIGDCIESLVGKVDKIVAVDGAYRDFPHKEAWSTDGTLEILSSLRSKYSGSLEIEVIGTREAWVDEMAKRSAYFTGKPGDMYVNLDADERLEGSLEGIEAGDDWQVELFRLDGVHPYPVFRIYRHRDGIRFEGAHNALWIGERFVHPQKPAIFPGVRIRHLLDKRDQARIEDKGIYYRRLNVTERDFRALKGI